jgi:outer membrane protein assembly factor BamB
MQFRDYFTISMRSFLFFSILVVSLSTFALAQIISATGGTIIYTNGYTIHTFTSNGTFTCVGSGLVEVLVVAGGGGGGCHTGGGGGAGGVVYTASYLITNGDISVTVGAGGNGATSNNVSGSNGSNSVFDSITAIGGGGGASRFTDAGSGGSGGGGSPQDLGMSYGSGITGQGYAGGVGGTAWNYLSGGGGGAGAVGSGGTGSGGNGNGGAGLAFDISGSSVYYGGGGGGGVYGTDVPGAGGTGGGGAGSNTSAVVGNGTPNTGGGGGGGGLAFSGTYTSLPGGNGGSGIVIVRYSSNARIGISSSLLSFGSVAVGRNEKQYLKIYNYGKDSSLVINNITSSNAAFIVDRTSLTIPAMTCDSILITFLPTTQGTIFNDSLIITSSDTVLPIVKVSLTGSSTCSQPKVAFTLNLGGPVYAGLSILGDSVMYAIASNNAVYKMSTAGYVAYSLQVGGDIRSSSSISYDTTVYIASSDRNLYAFSKDGNSIWSLPTGGGLTATPVIDSIANRIYIGLSNKNFIAVNRTTGKVDWNYFADDQIKQSAVVTADRKLIFATQKGTLYGFDLNNLTPATPTWQIALPDTIPSSIALDNQGCIYVGTSAGRLLKISMPANQQPSIVWQAPIGQAIIGSPVIDANGTLYVGSLDAKLYAIDIQSDSVKWAFSTKGAIRSTPAISDAGNIFVANDSGEVISLDANKNIRWYYKTNNAIAAPLLYYKSTLYVGTLGNQVIALPDVVDSSQTSPLPKFNAFLKITGKPIWATFQGNNQRTGMFSSSGTTGIKNSSSGLPIDYTLAQNYPNPFNPTTTIQFALPKDVIVSIKVFNILGQHVATLVNGYQYAGYHELTFNMDSFSSGIYFYQMRAGSFIETKKMMLMK